MILPRGFVQANALNLESIPSYDCSSSSMLWSSLLLYAMLSGFFGIVNSPSSVALSLVVQAISIPLDLISCR